MEILSWKPTHPLGLGRIQKEEKGFTLIELLTSLAIFSFCLIGIINMLVVSLYANKVADDFTQATTLAQHKIEEMKKIATEEEDQSANLLGFDYLISTEADGYLSTMYDNATHGDETGGDGIYTNQEIVDLKTQNLVPNDPGISSMTRTWSIQTHEDGDFTQPNTVNLIELSVTTSWTDKIKTRSATLKTLIHRRRFVQ